MRAAAIVGILLVVLGAAILLFDIKVPDSERLFRIGDVEATVTDRKSIPDWIGIVALAGGVLLIAGSTARRRV